MRSATREAMLDRWREHRAEFGFHDPGDRLGRRLISRHSSPWRRYHGLDHLRFLFDEVDARAQEISERSRLILTAWFHDAIYVTWRKDNEARSAEWAEAELPALGASESLVKRVSQLIRRTANHAEGGADHDDDLFLDMDCAILGAPPEIYNQYARGVRAEYWWVPPGRYRAGRKAFLESQLNRAPLFLTKPYQDSFARQALLNMRAEAASL